MADSFFRNSRDAQKLWAFYYYYYYYYYYYSIAFLGANWLSRQTLYIWETFTSHSHIRRDQ